MYVPTGKVLAAPLLFDELPVEHVTFELFGDFSLLSTKNRL